ncbi:aminopeptidase N [Enemella dayhoffiae]|uniref:Aminopeptidase N n=1 Tax=Enemella dayhoffiae TaxID=2016507 RepID=A0A255GZ83_9ACTN|nr:aminopeptidase N [Enemella dayhoffiae]OYO20947.1 aminopeptidase N [Enemella dayhoffiae]
MYPANITRQDTRARAALVQTEAYQLLIDLTGRAPDGAALAHPEQNFVTTSTLRFSSRAGMTCVDAIADELLSAELDGKPLDTTAFNGERLPIELTDGPHVLTIVGLHRYSRSGQGLHRFVDPADGGVYLYTQFEPADARRVYANFEQPDAKARFTTSVLAPADWVVLSNSPDADPTPIGDGFARWDFQPTKKISTYLTAIVAGDYHREKTSITSQAGTIPASVLCRRSLADKLDTDRIMATTQGGFEVFEESFGTPYPFESYDQAFVPEYNMGAMENVGLVTFRDDLIFRSRATSAQYESRDNTILHELAHMWFGDLVTMRWWDDLWLKESFAEWASHFAQSRLHTDRNHAWASFSNARKTWAYRADQLPSTHPIAADMVDLEAVELNFDGITYAKGASTLRQLVAFVGEDAFLAGAKQYFARHAYGNTELADLLAVLQEASGRDLSDWSRQWLESTGVNTLSAEFTTDKCGVMTEFAIRQTSAAAHPTLRTHRVAIGLYELVDGRLRRAHRVETDIAGELTQVKQLVGKHQPDLVLVNDDDLTFAKVRLDPRSRRAAIEHLNLIDDELARALVWGSAWDMCRDAELPVADYLQLVLTGVGSETDLTAVSRVLGQVQTAISRYVPAEAQAGLRSQLITGLAGLLRDAEPGSDHQLAFTRALASTIDGPAGVTLLDGWLKGEEVPDGLEVDAELRWHLLTQLTRLGVADDALIDAELERDNTSSGAEHAAGARAAMPTEAAKAAAWQLATATAGIPNETHRSICAHFNQPGQAEVLAPYAERYLDLAELISGRKGVWAENGTVLAQAALTHLFPWPTADEEFLKRLDEWLAEAQLEDSARRIIGECRDDAQRALRAREFNAG